MRVVLCIALVSWLGPVATAHADEPAPPAAPPVETPPAPAPPPVEAAPAPPPAPPPTDRLPADPERGPAAVPMPPHAPPPPSVTLKQGSVSATLAAEINVSAHKAFEPVSIAPDVSYGATSDLTFSLIHSTFGTTGFRGGTGRGLCVTGTGKGCAGGVYNNVGGEVLYGVLHCPFALGLLAGFYVNPGAPTVALANDYDVKLGAKTKLVGGPLSVTVNPAVFLATNRRGAMVPSPDLLYVPIGVSVKLASVLSAGLGSGVFSLDLSHVADNYTIPVGANAVVTLPAGVQLGASFTFAKLTGAKKLRDAMPSAVGTDFRGVHVWLTYTR